LHSVVLFAYYAIGTTYTWNPALLANEQRNGSVI
jgi:hypothetical protein